MPSETTEIVPTWPLKAKDFAGPGIRGAGQHDGAPDRRSLEHRVGVGPLVPRSRAPSGRFRARSKGFRSRLKEGLDRDAVGLALRAVWSPLPRARLGGAGPRARRASGRQPTLAGPCSRRRNASPLLVTLIVALPRRPGGGVHRLGDARAEDLGRRLLPFRPIEPEVNQRDHPDDRDSHDPCKPSPELHAAISPPRFPRAPRG